MKTSILTLAFAVISLFASSSQADVYFPEVISLSKEGVDRTHYFTKIAQSDGISLRVPKIKEDEVLSVGRARLKCDRPVRFKKQVEFKIGSEFQFNLLNPKIEGNKLRLKINDENTQCTLKYSIQDGPEQLITFKPYSVLLPEIISQEKGPVDESELLENGVRAIQKRLKVLTGKDFSSEDILNRDPQLALDIEAAPQYDFILFSTLQYNNDFISNVMFRSLVLHAKRGTPVLMIVNKVLMGKKERNLLDWAAAQSHNIKFLEYSYKLEKKNLDEWIDTKHRVSHAKVVLTYSKNHPERNHLIAGGRNNSDRYFFEEFKKLEGEQYTNFQKELLNKWAYFNDLDFYVRSRGQVVSVLNQMLDFAQIKKAPESTVSSDSEDFHYFISVPYNDERKLEVYYVDAINSAKESIRIFTPYIFFTPAIKEAIRLARERGVRIDIITSQYLIGDSMTAILKKAYDWFVYENIQLINVHHYQAQRRDVLHKKSMLIDNELLMLGSVNLSQRSFVHDIELNVQIRDKKMIQDFLRVYNSFLAGSVPNEPKKVKSVLKDLAKLLKTEDML